MKRKIITCIFIIAAFLLQSTIFGRLTFSGIRPNLLIAVTASIGFMRGRKEGMGVGFICGLLVDIFWGGLIGFYALIYTVIGYMNGSFQRMFYEDDIKLPLAMIGISDLIIWFLEHVMLPELVYTILVTLVLYQIILHINRKLEKEEQRSASRFV